MTRPCPPPFLLSLFRLLTVFLQLTVFLRPLCPPRAMDRAISRTIFRTMPLLIALLAGLPLTPPAQGQAALARDDTPDFGPALVLVPRSAPPAAAGQGPPLLVVGDDPGGRLRPRLRMVARLRASRARVELRGRFCNSACTLLLGAGDVCVAPHTRFGFHGPHYLGTMMPAQRFEFWSARMAAVYPPRLRHWFMTTARHAGAVPLTLTGAELIALGIPRC